jgi:hypothetical protein
MESEKMDYKYCKYCEQITMHTKSSGCIECKTHGRSATLVSLLFVILAALLIWYFIKYGKDYKKPMDNCNHSGLHTANYHSYKFVNYL